jgi:hypothetical protein
MNLTRTLAIAAEKTAAAEAANAELQEFLNTRIVAKLAALHQVGRSVLNKAYATNPPPAFGWLSKGAAGLKVDSCTEYTATVSGRFLPPTEFSTSTLKLSNREFASKVRAAIKIEKATAKAVAERERLVEQHRIASRREADRLAGDLRIATTERTRRLASPHNMHGVTGRPPAKR